MSLPQFHETEVDGVPTFWSEAAGPLLASLVFRVGKADETLIASGLSHLVEHLALTSLDDPHHQYNGFVDNLRTAFIASGTPDEISAFLTDLCRGLIDLPTDRLDAESRILATESSSSGGGLIDQLLSLRYGAAGHGLTAYQELGLRWLDAEAVRTWARDRFTGGNAALWLTGPVPKDLTLPLLDGSRHPAPTPDRLPVSFPTFVQQAASAAVAGEASRGAALPLGLSLAQRLAQRRLRHERGLTYLVSASVIPVAPETSHVSIGADCEREHATSVIAGLHSIVGEFAATGPPTEDVDREARAYVDGLETPSAVPGMLDAAVMDHLIGRSIRSPDLVRDLILKVRPDDIAATFQEIASSALLSVPDGAVVPDGVSPYPDLSDTPLSGREFRPADRNKMKNLRLVIDVDGIGLRDAGARLSIKLTDVVGVVAGFGSRTVIGRDGSSIRVSVEEWDRGEEALTTIDGLIPPALTAPERAVRRSLAAPGLARSSLYRQPIGEDPDFAGPLILR